MRGGHPWSGVHLHVQFYEEKGFRKVFGVKEECLSVRLVFRQRFHCTWWWVVLSPICQLVVFVVQLVPQCVLKYRFSNGQQPQQQIDDDLSSSVGWWWWQLRLFRFTARHMTNCMATGYAQRGMATGYAQRGIWLTARQRAMRREVYD